MGTGSTGKVQWVTYVGIIRWKLSQIKVNDSLEFGNNIRMSIYGDLAVIIEGASYTSLGQKVKDIMVNTKGNARAIVKEIGKMADESRWSDFNKYYERIYSTSIQNIVDNEIWKGIDMILKIRNAIMHGRPIKVSNIIDNSNEFKGRLKVVGNYLIDNKLLTKITAPENLFEVKVINHFIEITVKYVNSLFKNAPNRFKDMNEAYSRIIGTLNKIV